MQWRHNCPPPTQTSPLLVSRFITGSPSSKYEHRQTSALLRNVIYFECYPTMSMLAVAHISSLGYLWIQIKRLVFALMLARRDLTLPGLLISLGGRYSCLVPGSHYSTQAMRFGSHGLSDIISDTSPTWIDWSGPVQWLGKGGGTPNSCLTGGVNKVITNLSPSKPPKSLRCRGKPVKLCLNQNILTHLLLEILLKNAFWR